MKYIIMCGGNYKKWGVPKQLTKIRNETVVERTIRLLRANGIEDIYISSNNPVFDQFGVPVLHHGNNFLVNGEDVEGGMWVDCFYPTDEPVTYLMGDVVFSEDAIKKIVETETDDIEFFASSPPFSPDFIKTSAEPFGFKVANQQRFRECIISVKELNSIGAFRRHPIAWELWQVIKNTPINQIDYTNYVTINDFTCDIDRPSDIEKLIDKIKIKLTVIIPLYNQERLVHVGLDSIPKRDDIEIIVVDDCSTDSSLQTVEEYKKTTGKNITILHNERNRGVGYTVNRGLDIARGEYIAQLDSDGDYFVNLEKGLYYLDGTDLIYFPMEINSGEFWQTRIDNVGTYVGTLKFMRREFVGDSREPHLENAEDNAFYAILKAKNPTEKLLPKEIMYIHYNYPREGSLTWNVREHITPIGMKRE